MSSLSGSRLRHNVLLNLAGHGVPMLAALAVLPLLLRGLGPNRFGIVALAWTLVAVVSLFDLGFGRAVTQLVAASTGLARTSHRVSSRGRKAVGQRGHLSDEAPEAYSQYVEDAELRRGPRWRADLRPQQTPGEKCGLARIGRQVGTAAAMASVLGIVLGVGLYLASPILVRRVLEVPAWLVTEAEGAIRILALTVPAVLLGNTLRGVLEARQKFVALTLVRSGLGTLLFIGPLVAMRVSPTLGPAMWALVMARWLALIALIVLARRAAPARWRPDTGELGSMMRLGGWMMVSSMMASLMLYADRFVVAGLLSLEAVASYAAPFEVIVRLAIVPAAVMGVLFPAFSRLLAAGDPSLGRLYRRSRIAIAGLLAPPAVALAVFAEPLLTAWLGADVAHRSAAVASILAVGALVHGLVQPPFQLLQAAGRPDVPARFQLIETPLYAVYLVVLTLQLGIVGTALAWLLRVTISLFAQSWLAHRFVLSRFQTTETTP